MLSLQSSVIHMGNKRTITVQMRFTDCEIHTKKNIVKKKLLIKAKP